MGFVCNSFPFTCIFFHFQCKKEKKQTKKEEKVVVKVDSKPASAAPVTAPSTGGVDDVVAKITAQGEKVRALKSNKAAKVRSSGFILAEGKRSWVQFMDKLSPQVDMGPGWYISTCPIARGK